MSSGQVLVAGGASSGYVASAELFDPLRGRWSDTGDMALARADHTATLLHDGRVLVVGGSTTDAAGDERCSSAVELFDPTTGTWSDASPLIHARELHTATLLPSGHVLVVGGMVDDGAGTCFQSEVRTAELYDPEQDRWVPAGDLLQARHHHTATLLPSGRVLVVGGYYREAGSTAEWFDPATLQWSSTNPPGHHRANHTATLLPSGRVLVAGGDGDSARADAVIFDPSSETWTPTATSMVGERLRHRATLLASGHVLLSGGAEGIHGKPSAELFDPWTEQWTATASMGQGRSHHRALLLGSGNVLVLGGNPTGAAAEIYRPAPGGWQPAPTAPMFSVNPSLTLLDDGSVLKVGFGAGLYDPVQQLWETLDTPWYLPSDPSATRLRSGEVLLVGEYGHAWVYAPREKAWRQLASLEGRRTAHTATLLPSGDVLVVGGHAGSLHSRAVADVDIYHPASETWSRAAPLSTARGSHTATLLPSGKVLVTGGADGPTIATTEIYDPVTGQWSSRGSLSTARRDHTATLLPSGQVLVVAGRSDGGTQFLASTEIYEPALGLWRRAEPLPEARDQHTATLLLTGEVLVQGGVAGRILVDARELTSTEIYDPATDSWSTADDALVPQWAHTSVLLPSGQVLSVGGFSGWVPSDVAQTFQPSKLGGERRPAVASSSPHVAFDDQGLVDDLVITGRFSGDSEAGGGGHESTASNVPLVHLRSLESDRRAWLTPIRSEASTAPPSDGTIRDALVTLTIRDLPPDLHPGRHMMSVVTAGVWSEATPIDMACRVGVEALEDLRIGVLEAGVFEVETHGAVAFSWEVCHGDPATTCAPPIDPTDPDDRGGPGWRTIPGATGATLVTAPIQGPESRSLYRAVARGLCASKRSPAATLRVTDTTPPGVGTGLPITVVTPSGGELWPLSRADAPSHRDITWTMSDDVRVCRVDVNLLHSNDGGLSFPGQTHLGTFGSLDACYNPGEQTTHQVYRLPGSPPSGQAGSLYKVRVTVTDHAGNSTTAESERPFFIVEPSNDSIETLILWHPGRMHDLGMATDGLADALANLAGHPSVQGRLVDLGLSEALRALFAAWDDDTIDANALLFGEDGLRRYLHDEWLATHRAVEYLILVGDDRVIPFARLGDGTAIASENTYPSDADAPSAADIDLTTDRTRVGQALAANDYLSDDPLATRGTFGIQRLDETVFFPDLATGRLVETPDEIIQSIAAFISSDGVIDLTTRSRKVFVSAYDFLVDSGNIIHDRWSRVVGPEATGALIGQTWTSADLRAELCPAGESYGVLSLNGHATHHEVGYPSTGGPFVIEGLPAAALDGCNLAGSLVYAVGCHSGLPVPDGHLERHEHDLPQRMLAAGALAYLGNTGYGWGLRNGIGYSERLVGLFTQELTIGDGIEIGEAVLRAKLRYDLESPYFDVYDEKVSMQWTLFGFPMARLQTRRVTESAPHRPFDALPDKADELPYRQRVGGVTIERRPLGKTVVDGTEVASPPYVSRESRSFDFRGNRVYKVFDARGEEVEPDDPRCRRSALDPDDGTPKGCYYTLNNQTSGQDLATSSTDRPLQPLFISDVGLSGTRFHGFLWLGGTYIEQEDWMPIFAELQSNIEGAFDDHGALPSNSRSNGRGKIRHGGPLGDQCAPNPRDRSSLILEAGEMLRDADGVFGIERHYENIATELFYYNNTDDPEQNCDVVGPRVTVEHVVSGSTITWTVRRHPDEAEPVWRVVVLWTDNTVDATGRGRWHPLELDAVGEELRGSLDLFGTSRLTYFVQAVDRRGNVSVVSLGGLGAGSGVSHELPEIVDVEITVGEADMGLTFGPTPESVAGLTTLNTTVDVTNVGPRDAAGVLAVIDVPTDLRDVAANGEGWTCSADGTTLRCRRSLLAVGPAPSIHLRGTAPHVGPIELAATVTAASQDDHLDDNAAAVSIGVIEPPWADLTIDHGVKLDRGIATLRIQVTNDGPQPVDRATVVTQLPAMLDDLSWLCVAGPRSSCTSAGVGPIVDRVDLAPDGWLRYRLMAHVPSDVRSVVETTATVTPPTGLHDPAPASNTSTILIDLASPLFADGFESGELGSWFDRVGETP